MGKSEAEPLAARARLALGDRLLQEALGTATTRFIGARRTALAESPDSDRFREQARQIKEATLQRLDYYLGLLADQVERAGGVVHWARDASEARRIILELARARNVQMVVKSKSMATEEIHLNEALAEAGIVAVETDLGEYIIQLAHERPSHIIAPAIHKTKAQVAELFSKETNTVVPADPEVLTKVARRELREKFLHADMGISGVNFAIAETGTLVLITNEGNGRLVTTLPRIHVAVMGIDKVIPSLTDLMVFLQVLPRAATGQKLSVYTSLVQGPRRPGEADGPEELHLVILDNGRIAQLAGPLREALYCLRCGACLNVCPVYRQIGGHAYGHTYPGPIGIVLTAMLEGPRSVRELAHASSLCGACQEVCPVKIDIPRMLIALRTTLDAQRIASWRERRLFKAFGRLLERPAAFRMAGRLGRLLQRPFMVGGRLRTLPLFFRGWTAQRELSPIASRSFMERWAELRRENDR
ncbi:MAG: LutB/LldF family L-lactate oxidation iron-sulfur protein [Candidatus Rokuibacteriota bacterium]